RQYAISLEAKDLDGGTNLPVRCAAIHGGDITNNTFLLPPGAYRFTWAADADIAGDGEFPNVAVSVKASGTAITGARRVITFTVDGYTGTETLTNVPVLVRLSTAIEGFSYADFADAKGGDLVFCDEGESVIYPHEIDEWHVGGESLVWVKLPEMKQGTKFKMAYGNAAIYGGAPDQAALKHAVWRDYAGVWHMNEDSGTAFDSTTHGLDALPSKGTNELADVSQMVAYENGACGRARVNGTQNGRGLNYMLVPTASVFRFGGRFVASGWFRGNDIVSGDDPRLISKKSGGVSPWSNHAGFDINYENTLDNLLVRGQDSTRVITNTPSALNNWVCLNVVVADTSVTVYTNGAAVGTGTIGAVLDNDDCLTFGGGEAPYFSLNGQYDEIRLRGGALSADRIKADYDMIANRNFLKASATQRGEGAAE
ncbi:MAG: hypothetical protein IJ649_07020, partial [Oscillospiraceae bacterium]|nr:hypothetical protein [Oscillospiraceae bacterium]